MFHHDTESRLLLARERAELLANEMLAAAGAELRGLRPRVLRRRAAVKLELGQAHRKRVLETLSGPGEALTVVRRG
jgi:hypothetical protein